MPISIHPHSSVPRHRGRSGKAAAHIYFACPECRSSVVRVHRRLIDLLIGVLIVMPLRRYQCRNRNCNWHGNLTRPAGARKATVPSPRGPSRAWGG
jgi:hypothetical protein